MREERLSVDVRGAQVLLLCYWLDLGPLFGADINSASPISKRACGYRW
jgi:hypothetical protein